MNEKNEIVVSEFQHPDGSKGLQATGGPIKSMMDLALGVGLPPLTPEEEKSIWRMVRIANRDENGRKRKLPSR